MASRNSVNKHKKSSNEEMQAESHRDSCHWEPTFFLTCQFGATCWHANVLVMGLMHSEHSKSDYSICLEWFNADTVINHSGLISRRDSVMSWYLNMPFFRHEYQAQDFLASCLLHFVREQLLSIQWQAGQQDACFLTNGNKSRWDLLSIQ
jgi:hypothetical protein